MTLIFKTVLDMSIGAGLLALLIFLVRGIIGRRLAVIMPVLCALLIAKLLIPISVQSPLSIQNIWAVQTPQSSIELAETDTTPLPQDISNPAVNTVMTDIQTNHQTAAITDASAGQPVQPAWQPSAMDIAALIWIAGMALLTACVAAGNIRFMHILRRNRSYSAPGFDAMLDECKRVYNIKKNIAVITVSGKSAAAVYGIWKPKLLISPDRFNGLSAEEKRHIILHELSHIKSRDTLTCLILTAVNIIHWFNPLVWAAFTWLRQDLEVICDTHVLDKIGAGQRYNYASTLVDLLKKPSAKPLPLVTALFIQKSNIKRRVKMISRYKKSTPLSAAVALVLTIIIAVTGCTTAAQDTSATQPDTADVQPDGQTEHANEDTAETDSGDVLAEYTFDFNAYSDNAELSANIEEAVSLLDGTAIAPNEQVDIMGFFSPITEENGWKTAPGIICNQDMVSGEATEGVQTGGGIDVTIYGGNDSVSYFAFTNHNDTSVVIHADVSNNSIVVEICDAPSYGQTTEETAAIDPELIVTYTLNYNVHNIANAFYNAEKAAMLLDGTFIAPGQELSLNEVLGPRNVESGWRAAPGIVGGAYVNQIGGGVSAVSNALYNAAIRAELNVVAYTHHSLPSAYVPEGLDATISTGGPDLKIMNPYDIDVTINCRFEGGIVTVDVYGPPRDYTVGFASEPVSTGDTPETIYHYNTDATPDGQPVPEGQSVQYVIGWPGKTFNVFKTLYDLDGNEIETMLYETCTYRERQGVVYVNAPDPA